MMVEIQESGIKETAQEIAEVLAKIKTLSLENREAVEEFRKKAIEAFRQLNIFLKSLEISGRYIDFPFYSEYDDVMRKWESGYRLVLEDSQIKVEEFDEWRKEMYPETENPIISFDDLPAERLANAIEALPDFLKFVAEKLDARKKRYQRLITLANALSSAVTKE